MITMENTKVKLKYNNFKIRQYKNGNLVIKPVYCEYTDELFIDDDNKWYYNVVLTLCEEHYINVTEIDGYIYLMTENNRLYQIGNYPMSNYIMDYFKELLQGKKGNCDRLYPLGKRYTKELLKEYQE